MLSGNRDGYLAFIIPSLVVGALIVGAVIGLVLSEYSKVHQVNAAYQENAERQREAASQEISKTCFNADFVIFSKCVSEKIAHYYQQQATNEDLQAQQNMAFWAAALFVLGGIQLPLGLTGIYFVWRSLKLNYAAVEAALESNKVAREIGKAQTRAYIGISRATFKRLKAGSPIEVMVEFANTGETPAKGIKSGMVVIVSSQVPNDTTTSAILLVESGDLGRGQIEFMTRKTIHGIGGASINRIMSTDLCIIARGQVHYRDVFDKNWIVNFQLLTSGAAPGFKERRMSISHISEEASPVT